MYLGFGYSVLSHVVENWVISLFVLFVMALLQSIKVKFRVPYHFEGKTTV